jgi:putative FmdB family regulatory protein
MPVYTYSCQKCGVTFDRSQKFSDKPLTRCPECRTGRVKRVLTPPSIVFKGSGWYATDHRSASGQGSRKSDGESGKAASTPEKEKPAKPESKSDD